MPVVGKKASDLPKSSTFPGGTYRYRVNKCELFTVADAIAKKADSKLQDDQLNLDLVIIDDGPLFGRHVFDNIALGGEFAWRTRQFLDAIEYPENDDIDTDRIINAELIGVTVIQPENVGKDGKTYEARNKIQKFMKVV